MINDKVTEILKELTRILLREYEEKELTQLDRYFYQRLMKCISKLKSSPTDEIKLREHLIDFLTKRFRELITVRMCKAMYSYALDGSIERNFLLPEEKQILDIILGKIEKLVQGQRIEIHGLKREYRIVRFLKPYPRFVASDSLSYGPFAAEDIAFIPSSDAKDLKEREIVEII